MSDALTSEVLENNLSISLNALLASQADCHATLKAINAGIQSLLTIVSNEVAYKTITETKTLTPSPLTLDYHGRNYLCIYSPVAITGITIDIDGIEGTIDLYDNKWNVLHAPERSILRAPTGTSQIVLFKYTNYLVGGMQ